MTELYSSLLPDRPRHMKQEHHYLQLEPNAYPSCSYSENMMRSKTSSNRQTSGIYRPLVIQCGETGIPTWKNRIKTWFVCWPDHCNPSWTIIIWTIGSCVFFLADTAADLSVAAEYFDSRDYFWAGLLVTFVILPAVISIFHFVFFRKVVWYEAYPVGMIYWSWRTLDSYFNIPVLKKVQTPPDAIKFLHALRQFQDSNRQRGRVADVEIYFGSLPQLILQSYIAATVAIETGVTEITLASWLSLCLSSLNLLRYEPSSRESRTGIIVDLETVLEPAMYDYIAENVFDMMSIVPRGVAIGCFLTVHPLINASVFFPLHFVVTFLWCWMSAPNRVPGFDSKERDFRGQKRDRRSYLDHFQAAIATLLFPPTHRAWPEDFQSWRQKLSAVLTRQFVVVTSFQTIEVIVLMVVWVTANYDRLQVLPTLIAVMTWTTLRVILHIIYYVTILFPLYACEWETCSRRRGLIAKAEVLRMAETFGGIFEFCPKIRPCIGEVLEALTCPEHSRVDDVQLRTTLCLSRDSTHFEGDGTRNIKYRLMAMGQIEKMFLQNLRVQATKCLQYVSENETIPERFVETWAQLLKQCEDVAECWQQVLMSCLTHRLLPSGFSEMDRNFRYSEYPRMYNELVRRNNIIFKRQKGLPIHSFRSPATWNNVPVPIEIDPILRDLQENCPSEEESAPYGNSLDFDFIT